MQVKYPTLDECYERLGVRRRSLMSPPYDDLIRAAVDLYREGRTPVAYRIRTDRGTVVNGWVDGFPNAIVFGNCDFDSYTIEYAYAD